MVRKQPYPGLCGMPCWIVIGRLIHFPNLVTTRRHSYIVLGVAVCVGNGVAEGTGVGVTRRVVTSDPAMLNAILRTTNKLMTQAIIRFLLSLPVLRTIPPVSDLRQSLYHSRI